MNCLKTLIKCTAYLLGKNDSLPSLIPIKRKPVCNDCLSQIRESDGWDNMAK